MAKNSSLLNNSIFNIVKTFSRLIFPVASFAYASRILGETGIGQVSFVNSIISYFTMLAQLGMNYYGTREAAKLRDNKKELSRFVQEMLIINSITTALAYVLLFIIIFLVPKFQEYESLFWISGISIALNGLGMEWLYQAMEDYQYITVRSVGFQIISFGLLFFAVRSANDIVPYAVIQLIASSGSFVLNFFNIKKYVKFYRGLCYEVVKHLKPILWLFAMVVSIELYTALDSTMLGFLQGDSAVGKYTAAVKANRMVISLITAAGTVLIPRFSYYVRQDENGKIALLVTKLYNIVFMISIPAAVGLFMVSDEIIQLLSGENFSSAGMTMRILAPTVLVIPFSTVANLQIFVPMEKEKLILESTLVGAVTNFSLNLLLIPRLAENGAAAATVIAETAVAVICNINIGKYFKRKEIFACFYQYGIAAIFIPIIVLMLRLLQIHFAVRLCLIVIISMTGYFLILFLQRNAYLIEIACIFQKKLEFVRYIKKHMRDRK